MLRYSFLLAASLLGGPVAWAQTPAARTFTNPLKENGPDPWIIRHDGYYYYTSTTGRNLTLRK